MDKKADTSTLSFVGGLIISAFIVIALIALIYLILPQEDTENTDITTFYFKAMAKGLKEIKNDLTLTFLSDEDYALVSFSKNINTISVLEDKCGKVKISNTISRPNSCQGSCLCLCGADSSLFSAGSDLIINCNDEKTICESFNQDILGDESCSYFLYYSKEDKPKEFSAAKIQDKIIIKAKQTL